MAESGAPLPLVALRHDTVGHFVQLFFANHNERAYMLIHRIVQNYSFPALGMLPLSFSARSEH